ncbi:MAG: fructose-bisphosphate aldolase, partial [Candidatus Omnitrophica bacterium]|nr:fructose-bisphosphate aldolase [Candidatus Omnitrophota bacterium]
MTNVKELLGQEAKNLLEHKCTTIPKENIHLPGPDYIDRIFINSDRPVNVLRNLQSLFDHGRLG